MWYDGVNHNYRGVKTMTIGEKIRLARQALGLSQRQLCGEKITRNMLSQIENGSARPSMDTLSYLAARLEKSVSYFLDETAVVSPNADLMTAARAAFSVQDFADALNILAAFQKPDPVFDSERGHLENLCLLSLAQQAKDRGQLPLAMQLLDRIDGDNLYFATVLHREMQLLAGALPREDDRELLLRAENALKTGDAERAICYLNAAENRENSRWNLLRGKAYFALKDYENAIPCLQIGEKEDPKICLSALEVCFRELGDFENAYRCACGLRDL